MHRMVVGLFMVTFLAAASLAIGALPNSLAQTESPRTSAAQEAQGKGAVPKIPTSGGQDDKIQLKARLVSITVTVSDGYGRLVTGLTKKNFAVLDDGVKQEIAHFSDEDSPVTLGIIYDVSGSMADLTSSSFQTLRRLFESSHQDDEYFIIAFNDRPRLVQDFTTSPGDILSRVVFVKAKGSTALYDGVYLGIEKARQGRHQKKALLIISDGEENNSIYSGRELRELLKESDVPVYSIGLSQLYKGMSTLANLSGLSGGMVFIPADEPQTRDIYTRIALALRHQYVVGFYPTDVTSSVDWHKVRINVSAPKGLGRLSVSYKKGYRSFAR